MPIIQLSFIKDINVSVQEGDIAYFINPHDIGVAQVQNPLASTTTPHVAGAQGDIIEIGVILSIVGNTITCDMDQDLFNWHYGTGCQLPPCLWTGSFIMFSKDNKANMSSILGYYASAQFVNDSTTEAEMFNVGVDMFESSK